MISPAPPPLTTEKEKRGGGGYSPPIGVRMAWESARSGGEEAKPSPREGKVREGETPFPPSSAPLIPGPGSEKSRRGG